MSKPINLEPSRNFWAKIAKENGWYAEPFFIQVWVDPNTNEIYDSVSTRRLTADVIIREEQEEWS